MQNQRKQGVMRAKMSNIYYCAILLYDAAHQNYYQMAAGIFNSSPIEKKICNFAVGVICHNLAKKWENLEKVGAFGAP